MQRIAARAGALAEGGRPRACRRVAATCRRRCSARRRAGPLSAALDAVARGRVWWRAGWLPRWMFRDRLSAGTQPAPAATGPVVSLAVLPFRNASGDPTLDSLGASLSQVLSTELGQSRACARFRRSAASGAAAISGSRRTRRSRRRELARVADFTNARRVLWGQYLDASATRFGSTPRCRISIASNGVAAERDGAQRGEPC